MADQLDFAGLREEVEAATRLPEFELVAKRARRLRRRSRLAVAASVLGVLAIIGPAGVASVLARPAPGPAGPTIVDLGPDRPEASDEPAPISSLPPTITVVAVDGIDLAHAYALVDVCRDTACDLQLVPIRPAEAAHGGAVRTNLLRHHPSDLLTDFALRAQNNQLMLVSARDSAGQEVFAGVEITGAAPVASTPATGDALWAVQPAAGGFLWAFDLHSGKMVTLPSQPPVNSPVIAPGIGPTRGMWVTGTDPTSGLLAVSVSHDGGRHWSSRDLGLHPTGPPRLASYDGIHGYLLVRTAQGYQLATTTDGGASWSTTRGALPWPQDAPPDTGYGLVVRPDGSVVAWLATSPSVSYLRSSDRGGTFGALDNGPGGALYPLPDGYVAVGVETKLSRDGATWAAAQLPVQLR